MADSNTEYPLTRLSLLVKLKSDDDTHAWQQFVNTYRPIIYRMACRRGFQDADAQDLAQQVLMSISQSIDRWEKRDEKIRFRHWLRRVAKNAILNALTRKPKDMAAGGSEIQQRLSTESESEENLNQEIELEHQRELYFSATERLKNEVSENAWQVFQLSCVKGMPINEVAAITGKTVGAAYATRGRTMKRMRQLVDELKKQEEC